MTDASVALRAPAKADPSPEASAKEASLHFNLHRQSSAPENLDAEALPQSAAGERAVPTELSLCCVAGEGEPPAGAATLLNPCSVSSLAAVSAVDAALAKAGALAAFAEASAAGAKAADLRYVRQD